MNDADDPLNAENRYLIESTFQNIPNAYDLPIDEFISRVEAAHEIEARKSGNVDPLASMLNDLHRMGRKTERKFA